MYITLADCLHHKALTHPEKAAVVHRDNSISYWGLDSHVGRFAAFLSRHGLNRNDRVAVYMEKSIEEAAALLAIGRAGGVFIDINHLLKPPQVQHIIADSSTRFLITTAQRLKTLKEVLVRCDSLEVLIVKDGNHFEESLPFTVLDISDMEDEIPVYSSGRVLENDMAAIVYTSGSTGKPKGVVLSHRNLTVGAESVSSYLENRPDDRILSVLPFSFDYGFSQLSTSLYTGATCVLLNYLLPNDIIRMVEKESITGLGLIPPLWIQLIQKKWDHTRLPSLRYLTNTGGTLPVGVVQELQARLPQTKIFLMYGLTEAFRATYLPPDEIKKRPGSIGKAIPNAEIWVLNSNGRHCLSGETGELVQRGAHVAMGYWDDPEKTEARFKPNPFLPMELAVNEKVVYSGDTVRKDEDGFLYFIGRNDEMIKTSGYRVSPTEIEEVLYSQENIKHAAVFGVPNKILGQEIVAIVSVRRKGDTTETSLQKACAENLSNYMIPKTIQIWDELPLNPNGKIDRGSIKNRFIQDQQHI